MPLRFLADENFDRDIVRGLLRQQPELDLVRVQDVGLAGADDPTILEWAARERRIVLTHDTATMTRFAYERLRSGLPMPGIFEVRESLPVGAAIADILLLAGASRDDEWEGQVHYLPLR